MQLLNPKDYLEDDYHNVPHGEAERLWFFYHRAKNSPKKVIPHVATFGLVLVGAAFVLAGVILQSISACIAGSTIGMLVMSIAHRNTSLHDKRNLYEAEYHRALLRAESEYAQD